MGGPLSWLPLLALTGCDTEQKPKPRPVVADADDCVREVVVPTVLDAVVEPDPHADVFGAAPSPWAVRYQWPSSDPSTAAAFLWRTDTGTRASLLEIAPGETLDADAVREVEGASFVFGSSAGGISGHRIHEVKLCGELEPSTTYTYRVGGGDHWSAPATFTTPGAPGTFDTFRVAIAGDSRGAYETWRDVLEAMDSHDPDFFLFSGDMVQLGTNQDEWDAWFAASGDIFARTAFVPAHGNHEFLATNYFAQFSLPYNEQWFAIRYGDLHLVSLNDTVADWDDVTVHQVDAMNEAFGASEARWKLALHHQPLYSTNTVHGSHELLRAVWEPVFDAHALDFVFNGHNHTYERSVPIRAGQQRPPGEGTLYIVSGGAGAPLYTGSEDSWFADITHPVEHYVVADFGPGGVAVVVRDLAGNVIDDWSVAR